MGQQAVPTIGAQQDEHAGYFNAYFREFCRSLARHYGAGEGGRNAELSALLPHLIATNAELRAYLLRRHPGAADLTALLLESVREFDPATEARQVA